MKYNTLTMLLYKIKTYLQSNFMKKFTTIFLLYYKNIL